MSASSSYHISWANLEHNVALKYDRTDGDDDVADVDGDYDDDDNDRYENCQQY